jgi:hypothetical protein
MNSTQPFVFRLKSGFRILTPPVTDTIFMQVSI